MKSNDACAHCGQKDDCRLMYEKLGKAAGENVAVRAIVAFLIPIVVFISVLAACQYWLKGQIEEKPLIVVSFLLAAGVALLAVVVLRAVCRTN